MSRYVHHTEDEVAFLCSTKGVFDSLCNSSLHGWFQKSLQQCSLATISGKLPAASSVIVLLRAILPAVTFLIRLPHQEFVYSNSQRALQSICSLFCLHIVVREIHRWLRVMHNRCKSVTFCCVPGHVGVAGNEQADRADAAAVDNEFVSPVSFPARDYYAHFSAALRRRWHLSW